jgi:hypothetical protein
MGWLDSIGNAISGAVNAVEGAVSDAAHAVEGAAESVAKGVEGFAGEAFEVLKSGASAAIDGVEDVARDVGNEVEDVARDTGNFVTRAAKAVANWAAPALEGIYDGVKDVVGGVAGGLLEFGKGLFVDGIGGFASHLIHGDVKGAFQSLINGADHAFLQAPMKMVNGVIDGVQDAADGVTKLLPDAVGGPLRQVIDRGTDIVRTAANTVGEVARDAFRFVTETPLNFASDLYDAGKYALKGDWKNAIASFGMAFIHVGTHALNTAFDAVVRSLQGAEHIVMTGIGQDPPSRKLTDQEKALLREVYGDAVDVDSIRIVEGGPLNDKMAAHTVGNTIYLPSGTSGNGALFDASGKLTDYGSTLVHETCHVWQSENGGGEYIGQSLYNQGVAELEGKSRDAAYDYTAAVAAGVPFEDLNLEQQAEYVQTVLGPILAQPGDAATNLANSGLSGHDLEYAQQVLNDLRSGQGAA